MARYTLTARIREQKGKEASKKLRSSNQLPAIFYGPKVEPMMLTVNLLDIQKIMKKTAGENIILGLQIESEKGSDSRVVMIKELQTDPVKDTYIHADFYEVSMDKEIAIDVPVRLINTPEGVKNGGILQHVRREITISCLPDKLMEHIDVDVSDLDIGDSLHIRDIVLPEGIKALQEETATVAVVIAPTVSQAQEAEAEGEEEGEEKVLEKGDTESEIQE